MRRSSGIPRKYRSIARAFSQKLRDLTQKLPLLPNKDSAEEREQRQGKGDLERRREAKMGNSSACVLLFCAFIAVHMVVASSAVDFSGDGHHFQLGWIPARSACQGSIAECLVGEEFEMDSEINRRILATKKYISYGALSRNSVPCSRRGASYYNCKPGAEANPYTRGCSTITRCRR